MSMFVEDEGEKGHVILSQGKGTDVKIKTVSADGKVAEIILPMLRLVEALAKVNLPNLEHAMSSIKKT